MSENKSSGDGYYLSPELKCLKGHQIKVTCPSWGDIESANKTANLPVDTTAFCITSNMEVVRVANGDAEKCNASARAFQKAIAETLLLILEELRTKKDTGKIR